MRENPDARRARGSFDLKSKPKESRFWPDLSYVYPYEPPWYVFFFYRRRLHIYSEMIDHMQIHLISTYSTC